MTPTASLAPDRFARYVASPRGFRQSYVREGAGGRPAVLVHGWPETSRIWWRVLEPLAAAGFDVVAPDLRGFGESEIAPEGVGDAASHSADLYALLREEIGFDRVILVAGAVGGIVAQDLALRFPGFVERLVLFDVPLPGPTEDTLGLLPRPAATASHGLRRPGSGVGARGFELDSPERRCRYVAGFYTSRRWARSESFASAEIDFLTEPFADGARLRASIAAYESVFHVARRRAPLGFEENPTPALLLFTSADGSAPAGFEAMAARVFPNHVGPLRVGRVGCVLPWEAAEELCGAIRPLSRPDPPPTPREQVAYVSLGSNLGPRERHLGAAFAALRALPDVNDVVASRIYETDPVGPGDQGTYLNAVARLRTGLTPRALLGALRAIERGQGRERGPERNAPRTLDLDLLLHGECTLDEPDLCVPHPRLGERPFVLEPLCDLAPELVPPGGRECVAALAAAVRDPAAVRRRSH